MIQGGISDEKGKFISMYVFKFLLWVGIIIRSAWTPTVVSFIYARYLQYIYSNHL